jgi:tetratricopeptide (TPR) repeat protein
MMFASGFPSSGNGHSQPMNKIGIMILLTFAFLSFAQGEEKTEPPKLGIAEGRKTGLLPPNTENLAQKAAKAFAAQDWKGARKAYQEMLEVDPENSLAWANLGAVEQQAGQIQAAIDCFEKSVGFNSDLVQSWLALGQLYAARGDKYRAISVFARAIHEDPQDARAHNYLAIVCKNLGWTDAAEAELQRAIELNPEYGIAHFNLALMYLERKPPALELTRRHYDKAVQLGLERDDIVERKLKE